MGVPFTLRDPIIRQMGFKFENDFVLIPMTLHLCSSLKDALLYHKRVMDDFKKSLLPVGMFFVRIITNYALPARIMRRAAFKYANKLTIVFSNVPGPSPTFRFNGQGIKKIMFLNGGVG